MLAAGLRKTGGVMRNLTMTTALDAQNAFIEAADLAYMQISTGAFDYNSAIRHAVTDLADRGIKTVRFAGREDQLEVAVRRTVLTGINQTTGALQWARADEMGSDLVETSAHIGARPEHEVWQGQVFSRSGTSKKYPDFVTSTGYGSAGGLMGVNCRHSYYPFFEGLSKRAYKDEQLDEYASKKITYQGQEMSVYDATQKQRGIERKIRYWKRQKGALEAAGLDASEESIKVYQWQANMRDFIDQMNQSVKSSGEGWKWHRQREREWIGHIPDLTKKVDKINFRSVEYQYVTDLGDIAGTYPVDNPGLRYVTKRPVIYNKYSASHLTDEQHRLRISWLESNQSNITRAIESPEIIERNLRLRSDGFYSSTQIVELQRQIGSERKFLAIAISLSKNLTGIGWHQITTIYPIKYRDLFFSTGEIKQKYVSIK